MTRFRLFFRQLLPACLLAAVPGCYSYAPLETTEPAPQSLVRARISVAEAEQLKDLIFLDDRLVEGTVIEADAARILLQVPSATRNAAGGLQVLHQRVSISRAGIIEIESKRLNKGRTALAAGIGALLVGGVIFEAVRGDPGKEGLPGEEPGSELRVPILRWRH